MRNTIHPIAPGGTLYPPILPFRRPWHSITAPVPHGFVNRIYPIPATRGPNGLGGVHVHPQPFAHGNPGRILGG